MKKPSIERVAFRHLEKRATFPYPDMSFTEKDEAFGFPPIKKEFLNKKANDDFKEKLLVLLNSRKIDQIKNALVLNDTLGVLSDQEIGDIFIPQVMDGKQNQIGFDWNTEDSFGWELLKAIPNNPMWKNLEQLELGYHKLTRVPKEIGNLRNLKSLNLYANNLSTLPKEIGNLRNLRWLSLNNNNLTSLPKEIGNLKNLEFLSLGYTNLTSLPSEIGNLKNLKDLNLNNNNLTSLPSWIGNLKNLRFLNLVSNNLTSLPKEIGNLRNLKSLWLRNNNLTLEEVPENLRSIVEL